MPQLALPLAPFSNRGLFRDNFLLNRLPADASWAAELEPLRLRFQSLLQRVLPTAAAVNEATLENDLIRPALEALGFAPATWVEKEFAQQFAPDYTVFTSPEARAQAVTSGRRDGAFYERALCLVEAKAWTVDLDNAAGRERSPMAQLKRYLVESGVEWGVLTNGAEWRLLMRDGPLDHFFGVSLPDLAVRADGTFKYFAVLFSRAAVQDGLLRRVRTESLAYAERLEDDLRERVRDALTGLGRGLLQGERIRRGNPDWVPDSSALRMLYDAGMLVLYRCLFAFYAESRRLLPTDGPAYHRYSLGAVVDDVVRIVGATRESADFAGLSATTGHLFERARALWQSIEAGEGRPGSALYIPRYNGGLFKSRLPTERPLAAAAALVGDPAFRIPDRQFAEVLDILARVEVDGALERVDYAELRERQLGSIYEGLLELGFRIAPEPLAAVVRAGRESWAPAAEVTEDDRVLERVASGELYVSTDANERRATGAFFTPPWVVEYIIARTVGPAFEEHSRAVAEELAVAEERVRLARSGTRARQVAEETLTQLRAGARERLLDFRILDPAMGSGHFLVDAVEFLATRVATDPNYEPTQSTGQNEVAELRRLVVERCVYGVDLSYLAVELSKLSLWLRTMVFGKPLDFLDHHLRWGNSLLGIVAAEDLASTPGGQAQRQDEQLEFASAMATEQAVRDAANLWILSLPTDTIADVERKEGILAELDRAHDRIRRVADLRIALDAGPELRSELERLRPDVQHAAVRQAELFDRSEHQAELFRAAPSRVSGSFYHTVAWTLRNLPGDQWFRDLNRFLEIPVRLAREHRFFHWPIEFADVWFEGSGPRLNGGFDAVIGNPPYVRMEGFQEIKPFLRAGYRTHQARADLYVYFVERAHRLLRTGGRFGMILSNKFLRANYGGPMREFLRTQTDVEEIIDFGGSGVFPGATVRPAVLVATRRIPQSDSVRFANVRTLDFDRLDAEVARSAIEVPRDQLTSGSWLLVDTETRRLFDRLQRVSITLGEYLANGICWGIKTGLNAAFWIDDETRERILQENPEASDVMRPLVRGEDVGRYYLKPSGLHLLYMYHGVDISRFPAIERHLEPFRARLEARATEQAWYELQQPQMAYRRYFEGPKIVYPEITQEPRFAAVIEAAFPNNKCFVLSRADNFLLALLNSGLMFRWLLNTAAKLEGEPGTAPFIELRAQYMSDLPVRRISSPAQGDAEDLARLSTLLERGQIRGILVALEPLLPVNAEGLPDLTRERSAPVRDLLAAMARELTDLQQERLAAIRRFEAWVQYAELGWERLPSGFRRGGWGELEGTGAVVAELRRRRLRLSGQQLQRLTRELDEAFGSLDPIRRRTAFLDETAEAVICRLYGAA